MGKVHTAVNHSGFCDKHNCPQRDSIPGRRTAAVRHAIARPLRPGSGSRLWDCVLWHVAGPFTVPVDEEVESQHLKFIQNVPAGMSFAEAVSRFNSNVSYSGLLHAVTADVCTSQSSSSYRHFGVSNVVQFRR